ncbi:MAG: excinuclease ABC subunit UvrA [Pseudomonadota bacterium]|nr:excinuclease ABC subunit UvrA [Pseudomonadota bacterium]
MKNSQLKNQICVKGARTHNLKNIDVTLPRNKLVVITGLSGSGKSSLAFDTLYAEGQRRYVESLSTYARQFLSVMDKPDVEHIEGLSPAISIEQKSTSHNPRSTVGTITEVYDYLRLLFARAGIPHCPNHKKIKLQAQNISEMVDTVLKFESNTEILLLAPIVNRKKGEHENIISELKIKGFIRARINGQIIDLEAAPKLKLHQKNTIEVIVDRLKIKKEIKLRLAESFETALELSNGVAKVLVSEKKEGKEFLFSNKFSCPLCEFSIAELEPRLFSFNSPSGACIDCDGLGISSFFDPNLVVSNQDISIAGGAIRGWDKKNSYAFDLFHSLAKHYSFDIEKPYKMIPKKIKDIILYGSNDEIIEFIYSSESGDNVKKRHTFEGIIPNMERRYKETESFRVREELSKYQNTNLCNSCDGTRLNESARSVYIKNMIISNVTSLSISQAINFFNNLKITGWRKIIAEKIIKEIKDRLSFLSDVGLGYLTLNRSAETLSGGESQRIRLASQVGSGLVGVMYILDEPSIGLHPRDHRKLLKTLFKLRDLGNSILIVEHDMETILSADFVVDIGPGAGVHGGEVVAIGSINNIKESSKSITGKYISGKLKIEKPSCNNQYDNNNLIEIKGAKGNNLKNIDVAFPIGLITCITGVSGSGKSTLINETLYKIASNKVNKSNYNAATYKKISGLEKIQKVIDISQSPIGRTPRSNPATYTGLFTQIRELFSITKESRSRGYKPGRFSFNVKGGRCEGCQGDGVIKVEMHFLPNIYVSCDACEGKRYNRETLEILYKGKNIYEVLDLTVEDALVFFKNIPQVYKRLDTLTAVGLNYIKLGQNATTLSGGEAQRIKLAKELSKRDTGSTLYLLDEPTTGLHMHDIAQLLKVLYKLRDKGNTIVIIEHNLEVIKTADWIIDLGPEGGNEGGEVVAYGTPDQIILNKKSYTGKYLKKII